MAKYLGLIFLFGSISFEGIAQFSVPLAKGNVWYYKISYQYPTPSTLSYTLRIIGDTLMSNGKQFWIYDQNDILDCRYIRNDSSGIFYWCKNTQDSAWHEERVFNFLLPLNTINTITVAGYLFSYSYYLHESNVLDKTTNVYWCHLGGQITGYVWLADHFGYSHYDYYGSNDVPLCTWELTGCLISDTLYGQTNAVTLNHKLPERIELFQNYPNPFNPSTSISFNLSSRSLVTLKVFDLLGKEVETIISKELSAGYYSQKWNASGIPSGVYFYQLQTQNYSITKKLILLK